ncbi:hypothetical protein DBL07_26035 [Achromobacter mucicolens]|nr:hypothetical protein DBL07_26035 [Achromobacter mucicolens]
MFLNAERILPSAPGRTWFEADIGINNLSCRGSQRGTRLMYSNDALL